MADQITSEAEAERVERCEEGDAKESQIVPSSSHDDGDRRAPEEAHTTIQMETLDPSWVSKINERHLVGPNPTRSEVSWTSISCSIHRVPHMLRIRNEKAYDPRIVSIGPFHYKKREGQLKFMEEHKRRYLNDILSRNGNGQSKLEQCFVAIKELEEEARKCYSEVIELDSFSFVEMMILDGCFIIEFYRKENFVNEEDPLFVLGWLKNALDFDLFLLENQIPFFILQRLFDLTNVSSQSSSSLLEWPLRSYGLWNSTTEETIKNSGITIQHLLHLLHTTFCIFTKENNRSNKGVVLIPSASKLEEGGIQFRKSDEFTTSFDITFQNGVIEIPPFKFRDQTNIDLLNYIAFEHCYCHCKNHFTTYTAFMDCLINNNKDVEILCREGIIENWLGSDEDLAAAINKMGRELIVFYQDCYLADVCEDINRYCETAWPKLRASLVRDYFKNPWAIISFIAAIVLLLLTMTQTFFSSFPKFAYGK